MGPFELILVALATIAGTFAATFATVACCRAVARRERDRQIFRAYLDDPKQVEIWLTEGALDLLEQTAEEEKRLSVSTPITLPARTTAAPQLAGPGIPLVERTA